MAREKDDLADVIGVVSDLAIDGLEDGVRFAADGDGAGEIGVGERGESGEEDFPAGFPKGEEFGAGRGRGFEFGVAIAGGLFTVGGEEVGPTGAHVAGEMLDDDGDGIGFGAEDGEEGWVGSLGHGAFAEFFVVVEESGGVLDVRSEEFVGHGRIVHRGGDWAQELGLHGGERVG